MSASVRNHKLPLQVAAPHVIGSAGTRPSPFGSLTRQHVNVAAPKVLQRIVAAPEQPGASSLAKPPASSLHLMQTNAFPRVSSRKVLGCVPCQDSPRHCAQWLINTVEMATGWLLWLAIFQHNFGDESFS